MGYFAVVLTRQDTGWAANEVDLDEVDDLSDLGDVLREAAGPDDGEGPYLLFLEQEDAWFAVVRVDADDDPRVFVSDHGAVAQFAYAEMLLEAAGDSIPGTATAATAGIDPDDDEDGSAGTDTDDDVEPALRAASGSRPRGDDDEDDVGPDTGPAGDAELLTDLGTDGRTLLDLCTKEGMLPSEALGTLAENAGAAEALESVR